MTESEWLASEDPQAMLQFMRGKASDRKLRLFGSVCCRRIWSLLTDERSRRAVEVAELHVDGLVSEDERAMAYEEAAVAAAAACKIESGTIPGGGVYAYAGHDVGWTAASAAADVLDYGRFRAPGDVARLTADASGDADAEAAAQATLLREIIGNPFRVSPPLPPAILAWNDGTVKRIAEGAYDDRRLPEGILDPSRLAILADALLDAGCDDEELLSHMRSEGPHVRGCFAIDLILGRT